MTVQERLPALHTHPYTKWAWVAVALTPVGWAIGLFGGLASGEGQGRSFASGLIGIAAIVLLVAAPTAAVMLATDGVLAKQHSSRAALVVSALALLATLVAMPILLTSGIGAVITTGLVVVALAVFASVTYGKHRAAEPTGPGHRTLVLVAVAATVSVLAALGLTYAVIEENGADLGDARGWVLILIVSVVPGLLAAWAVSLGVAATGRPRPSLAVLAPVCVLVMMAAVAGTAALGGRTYDTHQANIATACSSQKVAVLEQFRPYGPDFGTAQGQEDGTCAAYQTYPGEDAQALMANLVGKITADGWTTTDTAWDQKTFTRNGQTVLVSHFWSEDGQTAIRISVVDR